MLNIFYGKIKHINASFKDSGGYLVFMQSCRNKKLVPNKIYKCQNSGANLHHFYYYYKTAKILSN
jgi:hypothetical protein